MFGDLIVYFEAAFYGVIFSIPGTALLLISQHIFSWETTTRLTLISSCCWLASGYAAFCLTSEALAVLVAISGIFLTEIFRARLPDYYLSGHIFAVSTFMVLIFATGWGVAFIILQDISQITTIFMFLALFSLLFMAPLGLFTLLPVHSYLFRKKWHRPRSRQIITSRKYYPMVSLHVPCYAEPPDMVCNTLYCLSKLRYPNFEVIVVDNNTKDESLWKPVKHYCNSLGHRFRFFHEDSLEGAKAGALNYALRKSDEEAEIVGIVDSDYCANDDFVDALIGFFDDPSIGFVQSPHDYRGWEDSRFQRNCYWEYMPAYRLEIACLNEWVSSFIIGTMCLIRKSALTKAGGWAEWCLTEDSELALRIHAGGFLSVFVRDTMGRGLVPDSFLDYKKQRLRWTIGPIQQLRKHWRLLLPKKRAEPSRLTQAQRLLEAAHSLREAFSIVSIVLVVFGLVTVLSIIHHEEVVAVPALIWVAALCYMPSMLSVRWLTYRLAGCTCISDMLGAFVASMSLTHVRLVGSIKGWFGIGDIVWKRTNKFKCLPNKSRAARSVWAEIVIGSIFCTASYLVARKSSVTPPDVLFLSSLGFLYAGAVYLTAPLMALIGELQLHQKGSKSNEL